jgi:hypothetical protein
MSVDRSTIGSGEPPPGFEAHDLALVEHQDARPLGTDEVDNGIQSGLADVFQSSSASNLVREVV